MQHAKTQQPTTQKKTELDEKDYGKYAPCAIIHTPKDGYFFYFFRACIQSHAVYSGSRDGALSGWSIHLSGLHGDPSNIDEVCSEGQNISSDEDMSDHEEDDQMAVEDDFGETEVQGDTLFKGQTSKRMRRRNSSKR